MATCNQKTEVYSRIVGYYRPVQQWNKGKRAEYHARKTYKFSMSKFDGQEAPQTDEGLNLSKAL